MVLLIEPGDIGFSIIGGRVGAWVNAGQAWLGDASRFTHAFWVLPGGRCIEAMPGGARIASLNDRYGPGYAYAHLPLTLEQRAQVEPLAQSMVGTPYSFLDYLALGAYRKGLNLRGIRERVSDSGHLICSQLVDVGLCRLGFHLFDDGRLSQDVTPGSIYYASDPRVIRPAGPNPATV